MAKMNRPFVIKISLGVFVILIASLAFHINSLQQKVEAYALTTCAAPLEDKSISGSLVQAIVGQEDRNFFEHNGVHWAELFNVALINISQFKKVRGGSTIDMQTYKLCFQPDYKRSISEKIEQIVGAIALNKKFSKQEILSTYIQKAPMGMVSSKIIEGFPNGAKTYFRKTIPELDYYQEWRLVLTLKNRRKFNPRMVENFKSLPPGIGKSLYTSAIFQYHQQAILNPILLKIPFIFPREPKFYIQWNE